MIKRYDSKFKVQVVLESLNPNTTSESAEELKKIIGELTVENSILKKISRLMR